MSLQSHSILAPNTSRLISSGTRRLAWVLAQRMWRDIVAEIERRRAIRVLQQLDDRILADIGLTRGDVGYPPSSRALSCLAFSLEDARTPRQWRGWM